MKTFKLFLALTFIVLVSSCSTLKKPTLELAKSSYQVGAVDVLESIAKSDSVLFKKLYQEVLINSNTYNNQLDKIFRK